MIRTVPAEDRLGLIRRRAVVAAVRNPIDAQGDPVLARCRQRNGAVRFAYAAQSPVGEGDNRIGISRKRADAQRRGISEQRTVVQGGVPAAGSRRRPGADAVAVGEEELAGALRAVLYPDGAACGSGGEDIYPGLRLKEADTPLRV